MIPTPPMTDPLAAVSGVYNPPANAEPPDEEDEEFDPDFLARLRELDWLDGEYDAGRLAQFYGEYVISANRTILAHDVFQGSAFEKAEAEAVRLGIRPELLTSYSIPSLDYPMKVS